MQSMQMRTFWRTLMQFSIHICMVGISVQEEILDEIDEYNAFITSQV